MTYNLIGCVTFDSFGASVPTENTALRVHHKDGVVLDSIEEHPISFFAFSERLGQFASGPVLLGCSSGGSSRGTRTSNREQFFSRIGLYLSILEKFQGAENPNQRAPENG